MMGTCEVAGNLGQETGEHSYDLRILSAKRKSAGYEQILPEEPLEDVWAANSRRTLHSGAGLCLDNIGGDQLRR